jgi:protein-S-isoprenylcysteine O-methyltransferase Ste14
MAPLVVAFALLLVLAGVISKRGRTQVPRSDERDPKSSIYLGLCPAAILIAAALFSCLHWGALSVGEWVAWAAVGVMLAALALQLWSMRSLGEHFTFTLGAHEEQPVIERGPYRVVRHPGYLAQILFFLAFGAVTRNGIALAVVAAALALGYGYRIHVEELLLRRTLGARYQDYAERTARLLPWIF